MSHGISYEQWAAIYNPESQEHLMHEPKIVEETFHTLDGIPIKLYYVEHNQKDIRFETVESAGFYLRSEEVMGDKGNTIRNIN